MSFLRNLVWTACLLAVVASVALADNGEGTYSSKQRVSGRRGSCELTYTLKLMSDRKAEMKCERSGDIDIDSNVIDDYGDILSDLENRGRVVQSGTWRSYGDRVYINLDQLDNGRRNTRRFEALSGYIYEKDLTLEKYNHSYYGDRTSFRFTSISSSNKTKNALVAGVAILALGAIIANSSHHSSSKDVGEKIKDLFVETGGSGTLWYSERKDLRKVSVWLRPNGKFEITVSSSSQPWNFRGRWSEKKAGTIDLEITDGPDGGEASGNGEITLRNKKEISEMELKGKSREDGVSFSMDFKAARG